MTIDRWILNPYTKASKTGKQGQVVPIFVVREVYNLMGNGNPLVL